MSKSSTKVRKVSPISLVILFVLNLLCLMAFGGTAHYNWTSNRAVNTAIPFILFMTAEMVIYVVVMSLNDRLIAKE